MFYGKVTQDRLEVASAPPPLPHGAPVLGFLWVPDAPVSQPLIQHTTTKPPPPPRPAKALTSSSLPRSGQHPQIWPQTLSKPVLTTCPWYFLECCPEMATASHTCPVAYLELPKMEPLPIPIPPLLLPDFASLVLPAIQLAECVLGFAWVPPGQGACLSGLYCRVRHSPETRKAHSGCSLVVCGTKNYFRYFQLNSRFCSM